MISRIKPDGRTLLCLYPRVMFYSEKRAERRISPAGDLRIEIPCRRPSNLRLRGRITDISPNGVSFVAGESAPALLKGTPLESLAILDGEKPLWEETGEVRYVTRSEPDEGSGFKYGIQFGISRKSIQSINAPEPDFARRGDDGSDPAAARDITGLDRRKLFMRISPKPRGHTGWRTGGARRSSGFLTHLCHSTIGRSRS